MNATAARASALRRRWQPPERSGPAFGLSLLVHGALFVAIAFAVRWKTAEPPGSVSVELWGGLPAAAPAPVAPPPPPPAVVPAPPPPPAERPAEIIEQKAEPPKKRIEPPSKPVERPPEPAKKVEPPKKAEPVKKGATPEELSRAAEQKAAQERQKAAVERALAAAGAAPGPAGGLPGGGGISRSYAAQVAGCIKAGINFPVPDGVQKGQYIAEFEVLLAPDRSQQSRRLVKPSGLREFDAAVERAIARCDPFPQPSEGTVPRTLRLTFDPVEQR